MKASLKGFGVIKIDGKEYNYDLVIDHGIVHKRKKKASKALKHGFGHTPLSAHENIPWDCKTLLIGTGTYGSLPVMDDVKEEAERRGINLITDLTKEICEQLSLDPKDTNAILHCTC